MSIKEEDFEVEEELGFTQKYLGLPTKIFLLLVTSVILIGVYIGVILYGKNSIKVLLGLQTYEVYLKEEIRHLKQENAKLQKEYFELKELSGETDNKR